MDADLDRHVRRQPTQRADGRGDVRLRVGDGLVEQHQLQAAAQALVQVMDLAAQVRDRAQHAQRGLVDAAALGREREAAASTPAQAHAEPRFQVLDMAADRRAADVQLEFRGREAAAVHHGAEHAQQPQVDVRDLSGEWFFHKVSLSGN